MTGIRGRSQGCWRGAAVGLALVGVGALSTAWAVTTASAQLTGLDWTLSDLDPLDGVAPSITFAGHSYLHTGVGVAPWGPFTNTSGSEIGSPAALDGGDPAGTFVTTSIDPAAPGGYRLQVDGRAVGSGQYFNGEVRFNELACCFTLSPHTRVVFAGMATLQASRTQAAEGDRGGAQATMFVVGPGVGEASQVTVGLSSTFEGSALTSFNAGRLQVSYVNTSADPLWGAFSAVLTANGASSFVSPVPESAAGASLLAGIALLWTLRQGRRSAITSAR